MELLRNLRASTRVLFLYEVTTSRHSRLRTIAERLGMTVQGCSDYAHGLERDGLLATVDGQYRATKKGIEFLHDRLVDLRSFVERARREMAFIETTAAMAGNTIRNGNQVGLFMEDGVLVALAGRSSPSSGVAVHDATKGELVAVWSLEGIVALRPGRIIIGRVSPRGAGRRAVPGAAAKRVLRDADGFIVAALDVVGLPPQRNWGSNRGSSSASSPPPSRPRNEGSTSCSSHPKSGPSRPSRQSKRQTRGSRTRSCTRASR